ncbi:putative NAD-dependent protein deacetylase 1 [Streptomyces afghaniensis 772] [Streptomyces afghaniensis]
MSAALVHGSRAFPTTGARAGASAGSTPMTYQDFTAGAQARRRSASGWRTFGRALPNAGHRAVAAFGRHGAGSSPRRFTACTRSPAARTWRQSRKPGPGRLPCVLLARAAESAERLEEAESGLRAARPESTRTVTRTSRTRRSRTSACGAAGGILKPDVVFFGEAPPPAP